MGTTFTNWVKLFVISVFFLSGCQTQPTLAPVLDLNNTSHHSQAIPKPQKLKLVSSTWIRPTNGKIINEFNQTQKGIDIVGLEDQPIYASYPGVVVYSGNGLPGYGNLIIIKHSDKLLSTYAHNKELLVRPGEAVSAGQLIAKMGHTDTNMNKLHFEIRRDGKPVNPMQFIN